MRVGLLIGVYNDGYSINIINSITEELKARNCKLIIFEGFSFSSNTLSDYQCNTIYRLITKERIDGLIVASSVLTGYTSKQIIQDLVNRIGLPVVSVGLELEGIPSVVLNNSMGFEKIVSHLIAHGYKKIAHISGPLTNPETMQRRDAFMKVIYQNNLELPANLILEGNFSFTSGYHLTKKLIPSIREKEIDAIVCANDMTAIGCAKCLVENGINIPDDVAITGFDDAGLFPNFVQPITTVSQCFDKISKKALSVLFDIRFGKKDTQVYTIEPELIIRNSCGCKMEILNPVNVYDFPLISNFRLSGRLQALETENFFTILSDYLLENGILHCYIVRFMESIRFDDCSRLKQNIKCRLFFGFSNGNQIYYPKPFEAIQILPDSIFEILDGPLLVKPLFFDKIQFGYVVVSLNESSAGFIEDLGPEIGHYLENIYLTQERQIIEKKLHDTLESLMVTNRKLNEMTVKDNLDKLTNIRYLASNMLQHRTSGNGDYYLILIEIDHFIEINNKFGFEEGENLINTVSKILASSIRDDDFLSHQSCERYVILVKNIQGGAIEAIEKRFRNKLAEANDGKGSPYPISFTWGYAAAKIDSDFDRIYHEAELHLINQKQAKIESIINDDSGA